MLTCARERGQDDIGHTRSRVRTGSDSDRITHSFSVYPAVMKKDYIEFDQRNSPVGYLITFRCYGTWLHGDERGSVDRYHRRYSSPLLPPSVQRTNHDRRLMKQSPVFLDRLQRTSAECAIRSTCEIRKWILWTLNVRTNHIHVVVSADKKPGAVMTALKANATRSMKDAGRWKGSLSPWAHGGSKKYLWTEKQLADAIAYVDCDQGESLK